MEKITLPTLSLIALLSCPLSAMASQALAQKYACTACHQAEAKTVGPSWKSIADKYRDGSKTADQLAARIKSGGSGLWGSLPMPPQSQVPDADLKSLAGWVLDRP
jgi:cytochrome c